MFFSRQAFIVISIAAVLLIGGIVVFLVQKANNDVPQIMAPNALLQRVIGTSVEGRTIDAYTYGNGDTHLVFVGGIHGGYEWNSVVLAYEIMDAIEANTLQIPEHITMTIIPSANPDGVYKIIKKEGRFAIADVPAISSVPGRFNARGVDLNRNFDCKWKPKSLWRNETVSGGTRPFSEPEAAAIRDFVRAANPRAVVFWHSQANAVYASQCEGDILPETIGIMNAYARASGYQAFKTFDAYETSGDAEGWLASEGIPAITVELKTHETIEFEQNVSGINALFEYYR